MEGNLRFKIDWASLIVGSKFTVFSLFYFVFEGNFPSTSPRGGGGGLYSEGFWRYRFGGFILGGAYFRNFTVRTFGFSPFIKQYFTINTHINIFTVVSCYPDATTLQVFIYRYLNLVDTKRTLTFFHSQQCIFFMTSVLVQYMIAHWFPTRVILGNAICL